jgi:hypothetical protein
MEEEQIEMPETEGEKLNRRRELRRAAQEKRNMEFLNPSEEELEKQRLKKELEDAKLKVQLEKLRQEPTEEELEREKKKREIENLRIEANRLRNEKYIQEQNDEPGIVEKAYKFRANTKADDKQFYNLVGYILVLGVGTLFYWLNLEKKGGEEIVVNTSGDGEIKEKKKKDVTWYEYLFEKWEKK